MRIIACLVALLATVQVGAAQNYGSFSGRFVAEWLPDGRHMKLQEAVSYVDPDGLEWQAPAGLVTDGASIPWPLWSVIGSPFAGEYRYAAVIHDHYCETKSRPWRDVHKTFHLASLAGGTPQSRALVMYYAVYRFGPRWEKSRTGDGSIIAFKPKMVRSEFEAMKARIESGQLDMGEIERTADRSLRSLSRAIIE
jgi:hypothetical protein